MSEETTIHAAGLIALVLGASFSFLSVALEQALGGAVSMAVIAAPTVVAVVATLLMSFGYERRESNPVEPSGSTDTKQL